MMMPLEMTFHPLTVHHKCSTMQMPYNNHLPSAPSMHMLTYKKKKKKRRRKKRRRRKEEEEKKKEEEEDFQTVSLDDEHWDTEEIPDRHLCIHDHSVPHKLCPYPCPYLDYTSASYYDTLDLSDISEFEDLMTTYSNEDIPDLEEEIFGH